MSSHRTNDPVGKSFGLTKAATIWGKNLALLLFSKTVILRLLIINPGSCWSRLKWQITRHRQVGNRGFETRCWHDIIMLLKKCTFSKRKEEYEQFSLAVLDLLNDFIKIEQIFYKHPNATSITGTTKRLSHELI